MASIINLLRLSLLLPSVLSVALGPRAVEEFSASLGKSAVLPDLDPFYKAPPGFEKAAPGTIFRWRPVPNALTLNNKNPIRPKAAWQIQFRTQNSVGEPEAAITTVLVPNNAKKNNLFVYNFFSDAAYNACNPSMTMQVGTREDNTFVQMQTLLVVAALNMGYYVSVPDSDGPQAAFGAGLQSAYASLDSIRAVKRSGNITGISPDPIVTLYGYSGGAMTGAWTTEMQPEYAPDVRIDGAALGGLIPNTTYTVETFNKRDRTSFIPPLIMGLSHDFKEVAKWLDDNLIPSVADGFRIAERQCFDSNGNYSHQDLGKYFKRGYESLTDPELVKVYTKTGVIGLRSTPKVPWYLHETVGDDASPVHLADELAAKHCKNGARILYERNPIPLNHSLECVWGAPGVFTWLADRHAGKPVKDGCETVQFSNETIKSLKQGTMFKGLIDEVFALLGAPINSIGIPLARTKWVNDLFAKWG